MFVFAMICIVCRYHSFMIDIIFNVWKNDTDLFHKLDENGADEFAKMDTLRKYISLNNGTVRRIHFLSFFSFCLSPFHVFIIIIILFGRLLSLFMMCARKCWMSPDRFFLQES